MMDTLNQYIKDNQIPKLQSVEDLVKIIGGPETQYYAACYAITHIMLIGDQSKRRCILFHGIADTGKSWIAEIMNRIFDAYWKHETKG